jgi:hypothetical protein
MATVVDDADDADDDDDAMKACERKEPPWVPNVF